jgi:hypothetical protein
VWYDYSRWHGESGTGPNAAAAVLERAAEALPDCLMLHFALADLREAAGKGEEAKQVGGIAGWRRGLGLVSAHPRLFAPAPPSCFAALARLPFVLPLRSLRGVTRGVTRQVYEGLVTQLEPPPAAPSPPAADGAPAAGADGGAAGAAGGGEGQQRKAEEAAPRGGPVADLPEDQRALAWIQYMRFLRRRDVAAARRVRRARVCAGGVTACAAGCTHPHQPHAKPQTPG